MKNYFKIMLDSKHRVKYAEECILGNFIGADFEIQVNLDNLLSEDPIEFKNRFVPLYIYNNPDKKKSADRVTEILWTICKGIKTGDIVVCPNGRGVLYFGEVISEYFYHPESILPHRRSVKWFPATFRRPDVSEQMRETLKSQYTSLVITQHAQEIEKYIREYAIHPSPIRPLTTEKLLEDFLVENWRHTDLGNLYNILEQDGEIIGQQYPTDTGPIDILAISKDNKELLVVELKKGRASDAVVGQIQRYMGFVQMKVAEKDQVVKGVIIAADNDKRIRNALHVTKNIEFLRYHVNINLTKDSDA